MKKCKLMSLCLNLIYNALTNAFAQHWACANSHVKCVLCALYSALYSSKDWKAYMEQQYVASIGNHFEGDSV